MPYHMFVPNGESIDDMSLDYFLGSAGIVNRYWLSIGSVLNLPIIAGMLERADSEDGFVLSDEALREFKAELTKFRAYWENGAADIGIPDHFLHDVRKIIEAVDDAIVNGNSLYVG